MCLAVPGRVARWLERDPLFARAEIDFGGLLRTCHMACVPEVEEGDYVLVHAGVAIGRISAEEAGRLLAELSSLDQADELAGEQTALHNANRATPKEESQ